jgi:hypothetical protein
MQEKKRTKKEQEDYDFEFLYNKNAFNDVIGDPFAKEPVEGHYITLNKRSSVRVANNDFDIGKATRNTAQPNIMDFICDVERVISDHFENNPTRIEEFQATYITEERADIYASKERTNIEQALGKLFRRRKISPVSKYFTTLRNSVGAIKERNRKNGNGTGNTARLAL